MRVHCQSCDEATELAGLAPVEGGFGFTCACGHVNLLAPVAPSPPAGPANRAESDEPDEADEPDEPGCPKCGHVQDDRYACHRCGLVFAKVTDDRFTGDGLEEHPRADLLRARWAALRGDLDDEDGHKAFIRLCAEEDALEFAGLCYRRIARREDPRVTAYRDQVLGAALARVGAIETRSTQVMTSRLRTLLVLGVAAFILLGFAIGYYLLARSSASLTNY